MSILGTQSIFYYVEFNYALVHVTLMTYLLASLESTLFVYSHGIATNGDSQVHHSSHPQMANSRYLQ